MTGHGNLQEKAKGELQETHEALISARVERDRNALRLQQLGHAPGGVPTGRGKENASPQVAIQSLSRTPMISRVRCAVIMMTVPQMHDRIR